jgi:GH35 family endo-1,4-beta-xylanase
MRFPILRLAIAFLATLSVRAAVTAPPGGESLTGNAKPTAYADAAHGTAKSVDGVWRIEVTKADDSKPFAVQAGIACGEAALAPGELVLVIIKARSVGGKPGFFEAKLQLAKSPYTPAANSAGIEVGGEWQELPVLLPITTAIDKGLASLTLLCARESQTIEIGEIRVFKYPAGTDSSGFPRIRKTYAGREPDAPWRKAALERIERDRKADLSVRVRGADGQPLADAEVTLVLRRHEFGFGSAVTAGLLTAETPDAKRYREIVERLFSCVVFENDLKDFGWEPGAWGKQDKLVQLDRAFDWLEQRNIAVRGHYLMQVAVPPNLAKITDPEAIRGHFVQTAEERLAFAKDRVREWDVINHPVAWGGADLLSTRPGLEKLDREIYALAQRATSVPFYVNEDQLFRPGRQSDETFEYVRKLKEEGFRVDGVGNQAHVDDTFLPTPEHVLAVTDRFATLVPRQIITEFDITTIDDEELAADYTRDLMIACFSHPAYTGFLLWGFWEGSHWKPEAASWKRDWSIRKRGEVLEEWLGRQWTTTVTVKTGKGGIARWRGFPGRYEIRAASGGQSGGFEVTRSIPSGKVEIR